MVAAAERLAARPDAVLRDETADLAADLETLTERAVLRAAGLRFGAGLRASVRVGLANAPFFFFIEYPLFSLPIQ
jgi:hypothetical protein